LFTGGPPYVSNIARTNLARQREALIGYQSTVLNALEEVEKRPGPAIRREQGTSRPAERGGYHTASWAVDLATEQYNGGPRRFFCRVPGCASGILYAKRRSARPESNDCHPPISLGLYRALGGGWSASLRLYPLKASDTMIASQEGRHQLGAVGITSNRPVQLLKCVDFRRGTGARGGGFEPELNAAILEIGENSTDDSIGS